MQTEHDDTSITRDLFRTVGLHRGFLYFATVDSGNQNCLNLRFLYDRHREIDQASLLPIHPFTMTARNLILLTCREINFTGEKSKKPVSN